MSRDRPASSTDPEQEFLDGIVSTEVKDALAALPEKFRATVLLDVEGFSYKEIAEMLEIPIGTVMSRLHRGRKFLQRRLLELARERGIAALRGARRAGSRGGNPKDPPGGPLPFSDRRWAPAPSRDGKRHPMSPRREAVAYPFSAA